MNHFRLPRCSTIGSILIFCGAVALRSTLSLAQSSTPVDRLTHALDSLSVISFDTWKASPDLKAYHIRTGDPTQPGFDDSQWETLKINQRIYPDSCWLRKEIQLPPTIMGQPTAGTVKLLLSVDDYGYLWVNGESKGYIPWSGEFVLTREARPGQMFLLAIKAVNTGGPLRLLRAEIQSATSGPVQESIQDLALSFRVGQKLLGFDTYQTNSRKKEDPGIDKSRVDRAEKVRLNALLQNLAGRIDVVALAQGSLDQFNASVSRVRPELLPIQRFVKQYTLHFDANAHIDAAWLWREKETVEVCKNTFASVCSMMDQRPDFTYTQSSAAYYDWMKRLYPSLFRTIQRRVKDGRWEVVGGMWVEPDCNLPDGVSWAHHLLYAKRFFRQELGSDVTIGWNPDSFGYNLMMPAFYTSAGIHTFITQKIGWNESNVFPYRLFWWESPDGSRILSYFPFDYVNTIEDPYRLVDWLRQFDANTGLTKLLILFGVGDHGGGPSLEMLARIDRLKTLDIFPTIEHGTTSHYVDWLHSIDLSDIPVWKDELYLEYHQGTFTTQARMKAFNRSGETLLSNTEKMSALATLSGRPYDGTDIAAAWKLLLFNQFHDILPGSGIREVYIDAAEEHREAQEIGKFELNGALKHIAERISTGGKGIPVVVFNALAWQRSDLATVSLAAGDTNTYAVFDRQGKEVPSQGVSRGRYQHEIIFVAKEIPSLGYSTYWLRRQRPAAIASGMTASTAALENSLFAVGIDTTTGWLSSIRDKRNGKELLQGEGNELQLLEDLPSAWDAWNIGLTGVKFPSKFRKAEVVERGPVRSVVRLYRDYLKPGTRKDFPTEDYPSSFFVQDVILYDGLDRIDFTTDVDWWEDKTMLKVAFPLTFSDSVATYEIPYGVIQRSTRLSNRWEKAKVEVPAERWADLSDRDYGVSLLNTAKYGYDIKGNVIRLSLLRSPKWPDPTADRGKHEITYSLYPHRGGWQDGNTVRRGYELNNALLPVVTDGHKGTLPATGSFVSLDPPSCILTTMKKAEDSDAWIIQWYNTSGERVRATVRLPRTPSKVLTSNFLEEDGTPLRCKEEGVTVETAGHGVTTIKVVF